MSVLILGLLNNRLNLVFDWYRRDTKGMLAPGAELPAVLGASAPLQNTADLRSKGWEITVDWNDQIGKVKYNWASTFMMLKPRLPNIITRQVSSARIRTIKILTV